MSPLFSGFEGAVSMRVVRSARLEDCVGMVIRFVDVVVLAPAAAVLSREFSGSRAILTNMLVLYSENKMYVMYELRKEERDALRCVMI